MVVGKGGRRGGKRPAGSRARSVGAAGSGTPNGAILDDDAEVKLQQKQRFEAWAKGYRGNQNALKPNPFLAAYEQMYRGR